MSDSRMSISKPCEPCNGTGDEGVGTAYKRCGSCGGKGVVEHAARTVVVLVRLRSLVKAYVADGVINDEDKEDIQQEAFRMRATAFFFEEACSEVDAIKQSIRGS